MFSIVVAFDSNKGIGKDGSLPWHISDDLKLFKKNTIGKNIIMGKTTYLGLPRKLKDRKIFVVTNDLSFKDDEVEIINDLPSFLKKHQYDDELFMICGGASIYNQTYQFCNEACVSFVNDSYDCDRFFSQFDLQDWDIEETIEYQQFVYRKLKRKGFRKMNIVNIIEKKAQNLPLDKDEIYYFVNEYTNGNIPEYQASALLMAIRLNGMNSEELGHLTLSMTKSGDIVDLSGINGITVDKHSTGGVGDKTSMALMPMVAACGAKVAKMSGRALGFCGGTIDKLESIPNIKLGLTDKELVNQVNEIGIALVGQTGEICPADKKIYALRDVTATVESIPLIASSIMSKKLASGDDVIVLDTKYGEGAFMPTIEKAEELANAMVAIGKECGKNVSACLTSMQQPLGKAIGNALEVKEAIETLKGNGPEDFVELCLISGSVLLEKAGLYTYQEATEAIKKAISDGSALNKFKQCIAAQGGLAEVCDDLSLLPQAEFVTEMKAKESGYVKKVAARNMGELAMDLGAGRLNLDSEIDYAVGIVLNKKVSDYVNEGDVLAYVHHNKPLETTWIEKFYQSYELVDYKVEKPLVVDKVI